MCGGVRYHDPVVPRAGTWIEIICPGDYAINQESYPVRVRGLKFSDALGSYRCRGLYPVRVRGLKYIPFDQGKEPGESVPRAGTWIEICPECFLKDGRRSYPVRVRGLK